ncbi:MAG: type 2 isopentenyl-diphosphate Delta-isomerase [Candidatus Limnocylindrales bacterium]|nr:type 2 isopentenyl-diphosphate Delta-isomerase [Candidatus Limnocylindrales bacterium]
MDEIVGRKADHMRLATVEAAVARRGPGFDDVAFVHNALPEVDFELLDPSVEFLGRRLSLPLVIASMTGGHPDGGRVNAALARASERHGLAMGVGSQRAALREPALRDTYGIARREAPTAFLLANVGAAQLVAQGDAPPLSVDEVERLAEMISADAVIVHLNALQELIQPEGDRRAFGWLAAIERLVAALSLPVVAKETGGGVSERVARRLAEAGVAAIDVGGLGGTSFAAIEGLRATEQGDRRGSELAERFADWGIPTAASVGLAARAGLPIVATGGIRSGLDAGRAIALGATAVGVARPLLQAVLDGGDEAVDRWLARFREELLATQFLTGSATIADLARAEVVISGATGHWLRPLG